MFQINAIKWEKLPLTATLASGLLVALFLASPHAYAQSARQQASKVKEAPANYPFAPGAPIITERNGSALVNGKNVPMRSVVKEDTGYFLPDGQGGLIMYPGGERPELDPSYMDARELKLQVRELAEQLLANIRQGDLYGKIGMPTSFVNQNNFKQSSAFGRYIAEQMFHEFNQRGFPVREYRIGNSIKMQEGNGDFFLSRDKGSVPVSSKTSVVLVGTYYQDGSNLFINARLIRPSDGLVYPTGQMVVPMTSTTKAMLKRSSRYLEPGTLNISSGGGSGSGARSSGSKTGQSGKNGQASQGSGPAPGGADLSVLDQGYDIH